MYTHLHVSTTDADKLFTAFARKPLGPGEFGAVTEATLALHFAQYSQTYLDKLGATLEEDRSTGLFVLKFREYLAHLPQELFDMKIEVVKAEIVRFNSAPTRARAGYYENKKVGFTAVVERVFPTKHDQYKKPIQLYVQNITVSGPSLSAVQDFNTKVSTGSYNRFLVNAFE